MQINSQDTKNTQLLIPNNFFASFVDEVAR
jgi:hypothetical protein